SKYSDSLNIVKSTSTSVSAYCVSEVILSHTTSSYNYCTINNSLDLFTSFVKVLKLSDSKFSDSLNIVKSSSTSVSAYCVSEVILSHTTSSYNYCTINNSLDLSTSFVKVLKLKKLSDSKCSDSLNIVKSSSTSVSAYCVSEVILNSLNIVKSSSTSVSAYCVSEVILSHTTSSYNYCTINNSLDLSTSFVKVLKLKKSSDSKCSDSLNIVKSSSTSVSAYCVSEVILSHTTSSYNYCTINNSLDLSTSFVKVLKLKKSSDSKCSDSLNIVKSSSTSVSAYCVSEVS
ncbi:hypothetical protein J6590_096910, partial [Homalodisca vitripennis]